MRNRQADRDPAWVATFRYAGRAHAAIIRGRSRAEVRARVRRECPAIGRLRLTMHRNGMKHRYCLRRRGPWMCIGLGEHIGVRMQDSERQASLEPFDMWGYLTRYFALHPEETAPREHCYDDHVEPTPESRKMLAQWAERKEH